MPVFTPTRVAFRTELRRAAMELVGSYAEDAGVELQTYPGRPASIFPPTAFVDRIREKLDPYGPIRQQRSPTVELVVLHGVFDSQAAVEAGDAFVDGFLEYVLRNPHKAHPNSVAYVPEYQDEPAYVADWIPPDRPRVFYATTFALEGLILD